MKPSLQLRIGQQLTMTPQLQQAIRLLQLSTLDLQQEIQEALDSNPLLENEESQEQDADQAREESLSADTETEHQSELEIKEALDQEQLSDDLPVDTTWEEAYSAGANTPAVSIRDDERDSMFQGETTQSLQEHLLWQARMTPFTDEESAIALAIIDGIDESGYLKQELEDIQEAVSSPNEEEPISIEEIITVLKRIQHFDPVGVAARSVQECLQIQLNNYDSSTPWLEQAKQVVEQHMDLLGQRDFRQLQRKMRLKEEELRDVLDLIQHLEPRPGNRIVSSASAYVIPDVSVIKRGERWVVELNPDAVPKLRVNEQYAAMVRSASSQADSKFIRSHLQDAKWLIKSLESRNETLLKVARCIVNYQQQFFEHGEEAMKPMVLNDVAEAVEMHESTISRVTTQKFMHTPRGVFELKYFFSSHVSTESGGECSSTAIRALIKKLVAAENPAKPLSDSKIAKLLAEQEIKVARRTIAKYRESLAIPPSNQRKRLV
ncbi:RNA polymerase factor sigma-54 [Dongshaea marina]|uniref:RNA polymerase factor sigma-54 n=1 Tax=Dongshaea marina TaxID=2047966 RepID=UPI000D3E55E2|nr:RNA polymerase factor sigma-54 [Dongshaea marina]